MDRAKGVMGRMEWFSHLKQVYSKLRSPSQTSIPLRTFLHELISSPMSLESAAKYYARSNVLALSFEEILAAFEDSLEETVNWDQIIDCVISISMKKKIQPVDSNDAVLDISFPSEKLQCVPKLSSTLQQLSLAGNALTHAMWAFPESLIVLNLAGNQIREVSFMQNLPSLRLLNLSNNRISTIESIHHFRKTRELYIGYNSLQSLACLRFLYDLRILDCSYNDLSLVEEFQLLEALVSVKVRGNPLARNLEYKKQFPDKCQVDPSNITDLSEFRFSYHPFVPLKWPPKEGYNTERSCMLSPDTCRTSEINTSRISYDVNTEKRAKKEEKITHLKRRSHKNDNVKVVQINMRRNTETKVKEIEKNTKSKLQLKLNKKPKDQKANENKLDLDIKRALSDGNLDNKAISRRPPPQNPIFEISSTASINKEYDALSVLDRASTRLSNDKKSNSRADLKNSNKIVITKEYIQRCKGTAYHNPVKVMMIKPPRHK